jgi:phage shock protein C
MESKRLYRSLTDRKFAGVAGGLAEYFVMDPLLIRLAFVILTLAGGGGFLIYIILWIVTPENPMRIVPPAAQPDPNFQQSAYNSQTNAAENQSAETGFSTSSPAPQPRKRNKGSLIGGLVLITLGALFLADELIPQVNFGDLWPVILIVIGAGLLINTFTKRNRDLNQS